MRPRSQEATEWLSTWRNPCHAQLCWASERGSPRKRSCQYNGQFFVAIALGKNSRGQRWCATIHELLAGHPKKGIPATSADARSLSSTSSGRPQLYLRHGHKLHLVNALNAFDLPFEHSVKALWRISSALAEVMNAANACLQPQSHFTSHKY